MSKLHVFAHLHFDDHLLIYKYNKNCLKRSLKEDKNRALLQHVLKNKLHHFKTCCNRASRPIIAKCRSKVLHDTPLEHHAVPMTSIKLPYDFKSFEWLLKTGFTVS